MGKEQGANQQPYYGQVNCAIALLTMDALGGDVEFADAVATTLTVPDAPATHFARPDDEMMAIAGFDTDQLPE
jgi:hypothetical protein